MTKYYTGVGSRTIPTYIKNDIICIAKYLNQSYTLRSGGAQGADTAFEIGSTFNNIIYIANDCTNEAMEITKQYHANWNKCKYYTKKLLGRNAMQVLGSNLNEPSEFLICWTPEGKLTGGTATTIKIAQAYSVPVINLGDPDQYDNKFNLIKTFL